jgi:hypothetical protein
MERIVAHEHRRSPGSEGLIRNINDDENITGKYLTSDTSGFSGNYFYGTPASDGQG